MTDELLAKYNALTTYISSLKSVAVAFSGGVDSMLLLHAAIDALGDKVLAITASSVVFPERELAEACAYCKKANIRHIVVESKTLEIEGFSNNPANRCYLCKKDLLGKILEVAEREGLAAVIEGSNIDDEGDYRPGSQAVAELNVKSPLRNANLSKQEIRELSKHFDLPTWKKQSFACLASRFPYGDVISEEKLRMVDCAEQLLLDKGFSQVRVRIHDNLARIELLPKEFSRFMEEGMREEVFAAFKQYGFAYVTLDICGYRTGSMNEIL